MSAVAAVGRVKTVAAAAAAAPLALALGVLIVRAPQPALGAIVLAGCGLVMLIDFELVIGVWALLVFLEGLSRANELENVVFVLVALASLVIVIGRGAATRYPAMLVAVAALFVWLVVSAGWADNPDASLRQVFQWVVGMAAVPAVMTAASTRRGVALVLAGFLTGALVSAIIGLSHPRDLSGRLIGAEGDADDLAAVLAPAFFIAAGLWTVVSRRLLQLALLAIAGALALALVATQSRGGGVAIIVGVLVAAWLLRDRPGRLLVALVALAAGTALAPVVQPGSLSRLTSFGDDGSGRVGLWHVAARMSAAHPLVGVGIGNFRVESPRYVLAPGELKSVGLIVERHQLTHNTPLQLLAETGVVGLAAFLLVVALCLRAGRRAVRLWDARGDPRFADIARTVIVATIAMLAASLFLSIGHDKRLWLLLAIAPGMLVAASTRGTRG